MGIIPDLSDGEIRLAVRDLADVYAAGMHGELCEAIGADYSVCLEAAQILGLPPEEWERAVTATIRSPAERRNILFRLGAEARAVIEDRDRVSTASTTPISDEINARLREAEEQERRRTSRQFEATNRAGRRVS